MVEVIIMRGIPGSGKSTWIKNNLPEKGTKICSADDYWIQDDGTYKFDIRMLSEAHRACMEKFLSETVWPKSPKPLVVDNTNINVWEFSPYVAVAEALGYSVRIVQIDVDLDVALERGIHDVPVDTLKGMSEALYSKELPYKFRCLVERHEG